MIVDVVFLCRDGRRRLRYEVLADMPIRGDVQLVGDSGTPVGRSATLTRLDVPGSPARKMIRCNVGPIKGRHMLIEGTEEVSDGRGSTISQRQIWWCRLPGGGPPAPYDPDPPSPVRRDRSYDPPQPGVVRG